MYLHSLWIFEIIFSATVLSLATYEFKIYTCRDFPQYPNILFYLMCLWSTSPRSTFYFPLNDDNIVTHALYLIRQIHLFFLFLCAFRIDFWGFRLWLSLFGKSLIHFINTISHRLRFRLYIPWVLFRTLYFTQHAALYYAYVHFFVTAFVVYV